MRLDIFRKLPKDLTEPTFAGALGKILIERCENASLVSFACTVILAILCMTEVSRYLSVQTKSDMLVDISHHDDRLNINVDIVFPHMPCDVLSLDVQDVMGTHIVDISGSLFKKKLSKTGEVLSSTSALDNIYNRLDLLNKVKEEIEQGQGCQLKGYVEINRVPGNFHISSHAFSDVVMSLMMQGYTFDFTYKINHISFGRDEHFKVI